MAHNKLRT